MVNQKNIKIERYIGMGRPTKTETIRQKKINGEEETLRGRGGKKRT